MMQATDSTKLSIANISGMLSDRGACASGMLSERGACLPISTASALLVPLCIGRSSMSTWFHFASRHTTPANTARASQHTTSAVDIQ
eukprot:scaffold26428_cov75-Phaeocystis_antarctica.AAC.1